MSDALRFGHLSEDDDTPLIRSEEVVGTSPMIDTDGHHIGLYVLDDQQYKIDLTDVLGLGVSTRLTDEDPARMLKNLDVVGGWRYTLHRAWNQARDTLDALESAFEMWRAQRYVDSERECQRVKAEGVATKMRSVAEQISKASIEAQIVVGDRSGWESWQTALQVAKSRERAAEALYKAIDRRGRELEVIVQNLGFLLRRP